MLACLMRALPDLAPVERRVIDAIYLCDLTYHEAARMLGMAEGTLRTIRTRAMGKLRQLLAD
jgi:RNA polymerase sigma factor (sigma-70 family)